MEHSAPAKIVERPLAVALWVASLVATGALAVSGVFLVNRFIRASMTEPAEPQGFRIMTWNIGQIYLRWDSRASDSELHYVADTIRDLNPHVVALQELRDRGQLGRLVAALGPGWRGKIPEDEYDRRAALVVRLPARFVDLATSTGRTAQAAVVKFRDDVSLAVASVHLDAFDAGRRLVQAQEMVAGLLRVQDKNVVLAGDLNFDVALVAQGTADHDLYRFLTREMVDAAKHAGSTTIISRRLDYVFYRSVAVRRVEARVLQDKRVKVMDHDPLLVELSL